MLNEPTFEKLKRLKMPAMAAAWAEQQRDPQYASLSFDERLALIVEAEIVGRENKRLKKIVSDAKLRFTQACVEDIDYPARRELDRAQVRQLASCRWAVDHQNIVITGPTGTGKTYVACALAQQACRHGHSTVYRRASRLFDELTLARADGSFVRLLGRFQKFAVLVIDDWGLAPLTAQQRHDLLEVIEDRVGTRSTILTSQLPTEHWHDNIGDPTVADAICDRILHTAHRIALKGPSRRKDAVATVEEEA
jgi:DNA replication protein DnaC